MLCHEVKYLNQYLAMNSLETFSKGKKYCYKLVRNCGIIAFFATWNIFNKVFFASIEIAYMCN